jgi:hypothetical protein
MKMYKHILFDLLDAVGLGVSLGSVYMLITDWLKAFNYNPIVLAIGAVLSLGYGFAKWKNMRLKNKKLELEIKDLKDKKDE